MLAWFVVLVASGAAEATTIVEWDLLGAPGSQASRPASGDAANVTRSVFARGAALAASAAGNSVSASGWTSEATDYFSFGFALESGYQVDLDNLYIGRRSSNTGPGTMGVFYSGDHFATPLTAFNQAPGSNFVDSVVDLSALRELAGEVEFRLLQVGTVAANGGSTGRAGTFRVTSYFAAGSFDRNMQFTGTVSAISEPGTYSMIFAGLALIGLTAARSRS